jgi:hypothetical protein
MKRPISITIIGIFFVIGGLMAGIDIIRGLFNDHLNLNFGVLWVPVGFGLMKGRSSSRGWAKWWIGLFSLVIGGLLAFYPFFGDSYTVSWFGQPVIGTEKHFLAIGLPIAFLLVARWMWKCLDSQENAPFFDDFRRPNAEQAVPSDGHKPYSRVSSDGPITPADAH